jgi:hypothetical protein
MPAGSPSSKAEAMHRAPTVERGEESTRWPVTTTEQAMANGSPPPSAINFGTIGRSAGSTTPDVLL